MSQINVNTIRNRTGGPPSLDKGAVVTGIITATTGKIAGDLTVGGTLTYEDVTNIDSTGIVTAKGGLKVGNPVSPGIGATIDPNGNAVFAGITTVGIAITMYASSGIVSATKFYGDGSALTGIDATQIQTGNTSVQTVDGGSDGHIKMTTEGGERVRVGPAGEIGIGGANYGTSGQVLASGGSGAAPSWAAASTVFAGGNAIQMVADGAISAGKAVVLTAAGKVAQVASPYSDVAIETAAGEHTYTTNVDGGYSQSNGEDQGWAYGEVTKTIQHVYRAGNSMGAHFAFRWDDNVATKINEAGYGMLPYDGHWNNHEYQTIGYCGSVASGTKDMFVAVWLDSDSDNLLARVGINGTVGAVCSWSPKFNIESSGDAKSYPQSVAWDEDNNRVIVAYEDKGDSDKGKVKIGTITSSDSFAGASNCTITWGSEITFNNAGTGYIGAIYDKTHNKVVITFCDLGDGNKAKAIVGTVASTGNSITFGSEVTFNGTSTAHNTSLSYDADTGRIAFLYRDDGDSGKSKVCSGLVSGTGTSGTITFAAETELIDTAANGIKVVYDTSSNKHIMLYTHTNNNNWVRTFEINNSTGVIENLGGITQIDSSTRGHGGIIATGDNGKVLVRYGNGKMRALWTQKPITNITTEKGAGAVLGFVDEAVADGENATVKLLGNVIGNQSGLTVGTRYYVRADGTLGTSWDSSSFPSFASHTPYAGVAIATDKIMIGDHHLVLTTLS